MNSINIFNDVKGEQSKHKAYFEKLKSNYFLQKLFNIIQKNKSLEIIKCNKKLQKRLNLTINDYKEYI